jgi:hypothetical protein
MAAATNEPTVCNDCGSMPSVEKMTELAWRVICRDSMKTTPENECCAGFTMFTPEQAVYAWNFQQSKSGVKMT